jgi:hypothetical protein
LELAKVGIAMFVRLQWPETNGRYERIFKDQPPTLIAFFAERVNLRAGRIRASRGPATDDAGADPLDIPAFLRRDNPECPFRSPLA